MRRISISLLVLAVTTAFFGLTGVASANKLPELTHKAVKAYNDNDTIRVPYITWGGDMVTFYANGLSLTTARGSIYDKLGLKIELVPGDNFPGQVADALEGKSPFLRGTMGMMSSAEAYVAKNGGGTKGTEVAFQMTYSMGDFCVAREGVRKLTDLKGKTVAIQAYGPHMRLVADALDNAGLTMDDVTIRWTKDLSMSADSPSEVFRKDRSVDVACVITPDLNGLTGGYGNTGTGAEGTVKGAHVLFSTKDMSRSVADVYALVDMAWARANRDKVEKFALGHLQAVEKVIDLKKAYENGGSAEYVRLLKFSQQVFGKDVIPSLEDAHGLLSDAVFAGQPGNIEFFTTNVRDSVGFAAFQKRGADMAKRLGLGSGSSTMKPLGIDWNSSNFTGNLKKLKMRDAVAFNTKAASQEVEALSVQELDDRVVYEFEIFFDEEQKQFDPKRYSTEFAKAVKLMRQYAGAYIVVEGHTDTALFNKSVILAGFEKGVITCGDGRPRPPCQYAYQGQPLKLTMEDITRQVHNFTTAQHDSRAVMRSANLISVERAQAVIDSLKVVAEQANLRVNAQQLIPKGAGVTDPAIKPRSKADSAKNRRVRVRIMRGVAVESTEAADYLY